MKLTNKYLDVMEEVLESKASTLLTHKDLVAVVNHKIGKERTMSYETFKHLNSITKRGVDHNGDPKEPTSLERRFRRIIDTAESTQKLALLEFMISDKNNFKASSWILERKFPALNIAKKLETDQKLTMKDKLDGLDQEIASDLESLDVDSDE